MGQLNMRFTMHMIALAKPVEAVLTYNSKGIEPLVKKIWCFAKSMPKFLKVTWHYLQQYMSMNISWSSSLRIELSVFSTVPDLFSWPWHWQLEQQLLNAASRLCDEFEVGFDQQYLMSIDCHHWPSSTLSPTWLSNWTQGTFVSMFANDKRRLSLHWA